MIRTYYLLTKPGIIMGNAITATSAFALASRGHFDFPLFLATVAGLGLVIASACVFNNYIDRESDKKMERTKHRPLVQKRIAERKAIFFACALGFAGICILAFFTNPLATFLASAGFFIYVVLYSFTKYHSIYGTLVGSISGAMPPVVGYCAVSHHFDLGAFLFFLILVLWQMPHFFSIATYRYKDYLAASIPVLPVVKGMHRTKVHIVAYIVAFIPVTFLLTFLGYTGYAYLAVAALFGFYWLWISIKGFKSTNDFAWGRRMFTVSLYTITALCLVIPLEILLSP